MEILNAILLLWAGIIIIFQIFFIKDLQEKIKLKEEIIYRDDKIISYYKQGMEYFREQLEKYENKNK